MPVHTRTPRAPLDTVRALEHAAEGAGHEGFFASTKWWATPPYVCVTESGRTNIGGVEKVFDAEITEQIPDITDCVAEHLWCAECRSGDISYPECQHHSNHASAGLRSGRTHREGGRSIGELPAHRVKSDLERFKEFIESAGAETEHGGERSSRTTDWEEGRLK
jgi:hypothetical protein